MLSLELSGLVLISNHFEETFFPSSYRLAKLLLPDTSYISYTSHLLSLRRTDCELFKQYQSASQEMMGQISDSETAEPQEISIKICIMCYNALLDKLYRGSGDKQVFLQTFNLPKCIIVGLSKVEGLFSLL